MASDWESEPEHVFTWQEPPAPAGVPPSATSQRRRRPGRRAVMAVVGACALTGIGAGVAAAATSGAAGSSSGSSGSSGTTTPAAPRPFMRHGFGFGGPGGPGMGGAIRGEFVRPDPSGSGYQTVDFQIGKVSSSAPYTSSISVTSADGTTKTYAVTTNTLVDAGRDGVGNISNGDTVMIEAVVTNGTATAQKINDQTRLGALRQAWGYGGPGSPPPGATPPSPSGT